MEPKLFSKKYNNALNLALQLGYLISLPLVGLAGLGRFLDKKYDSSPILLLSGIFLAMLVSSILVYRKAKRIME
jgi:F0F1-type ATP synthase assembly protein I